MNKFKKVLYTVGMIVSSIGLVMGTVTKDGEMYKTAMMLGIIMICAATFTVVVEIKEELEKGTE